MTGFTDVDSAISASSTSGVLFIDIRQHPGGFGAARAEAERMAGRLAGVTGWPLGEAQARTRQKVACSAAWPVSGRALPRISAEFTPAR